MATSGDHYLATSGDFFMATDTLSARLGELRGALPRKRDAHGAEHDAQERVDSGEGWCFPSPHWS